MRTKGVAEYSLGVFGLAAVVEHCRYNVGLLCVPPLCSLSAQAAHGQLWRGAITSIMLLAKWYSSTLSSFIKPIITAKDGVVQHLLEIFMQPCLRGTQL